VQPEKLRAYNMSPDDVVAALAATNVIVPSGNIRIDDIDADVPTNGTVSNHQGSGDGAAASRLHQNRAAARRRTVETAPTFPRLRARERPPHVYIPVDEASGRIDDDGGWSR